MPRFQPRPTGSRLRYEGLHLSPTSVIVLARLEHVHPRIGYQAYGPLLPMVLPDDLLRSEIMHDALSDAVERRVQREIAEAADNAQAGLF